MDEEENGDSDETGEKDDWNVDSASKCGIDRETEATKSNERKRAVLTFTIMLARYPVTMAGRSGLL